MQNKNNFDEPMDEYHIEFGMDKLRDKYHIEWGMD